MLARVVAMTMAMHVIVVMASLTAPVLAGLLAAAAGIPVYFVGYYSALIYGCGAVVSLATPGLVRRCGVIRLHQLMLAATALSLAALVGADLPAYVASAVLLGIAYGPVNPASTVLLARLTPPERRARIFSLKQTAVPLGGALAGSIMPRLSQWAGWRGAVLLLAVLALAMIAGVQHWRSRLDAERQPMAPLVGAGLWLPLRLYAATPALRRLGIAAFTFGALQFAVTAVFATVLTAAGWTLAQAGAALSVAMAVSVGCRVLWGMAADRWTPGLVLAVMGAMMSAVALASAFLTAAWPGLAVLAIAALFGISALCWNGVAVAEAVREAPSGAISEASAGLYTVTFSGALAGPAAFSSVSLISGGSCPGFLMLAGLAAIGSMLLLPHRASRALKPAGASPPSSPEPAATRPDASAG
ncbi:MAG: MFS transporter [Alphaproteobacteria bacterium]|nr:MFS transporter [Alphaproteobacteria bacterium]